MPACVLDTEALVCVHTVEGYESSQGDNERGHEPTHQRWLSLSALGVNVDSSSGWRKFVSTHMRGNS